MAFEYICDLLRFYLKPEESLRPLLDLTEIYSLETVPLSLKNLFNLLYLAPSDSWSFLKTKYFHTLLNVFTNKRLKGIRCRASHLTSLRLGFPTCKMEMIMYSYLT